MGIRFPYERVSKNDRVLIYGAGELGQKLFWQIYSGYFCKLVGIVDKQFPEDVQAPLFSPDKIFNEMFDKVIIASINLKFIKEISDMLYERGISQDKIIADYPFDDFDFAAISLAKNFPKHYELCKNVMDICHQSQSEFAGHFIYQSFPKIIFDSVGCRVQLRISGFANSIFRKEDRRCGYRSAYDSNGEVCIRLSRN